MFYIKVKSANNEIKRQEVDTSNISKGDFGLNGIFEKMEKEQETYIEKINEIKNEIAYIVEINKDFYGKNVWGLRQASLNLIFEGLTQLNIFFQTKYRGLTEAEIKTSISLLNLMETTPFAERGACLSPSEIRRGVNIFNLRSQLEKFIEKAQLDLFLGKNGFRASEELNKIFKNEVYANQKEMMFVFPLEKQPSPQIFFEKPDEKNTELTFKEIFTQVQSNKKEDGNSIIPSPQNSILIDFKNKGLIEKNNFSEYSLRLVYLIQEILRFFKS